MTEEEIIKDWGERCPEYDKDCSSCQIWKMYDDMKQARKIVREIWWMARRYADGRNTYEPSTFNCSIAEASSWLHDDDHGEIYAKDPLNV